MQNTSSVNKPIERLKAEFEKCFTGYETEITDQIVIKKLERKEAGAYTIKIRNEYKGHQTVNKKKIHS